MSWWTSGNRWPWRLRQSAAATLFVTSAPTSLRSRAASSACSGSHRGAALRWVLASTVPPWRLEHGRVRVPAASTSAANMAPPKTIGTHSGTFHCDEVLACSLLRLLPEYRDAPITRSRDVDTLATLDCLVDVGAEYEPSRRRFDHHQRAFYETFDASKKTKLSSAGLVYKHFGKDVLRQVCGDAADDRTIDLLYKKVYDGFIEAIDANDNGINATSERPRFTDNSNLPARIARMNSPWNRDEAPAAQNERFSRAMQVAGTEFVDYVLGLYEQWLPARAIVQEALNARTEVHPSRQIMLLKRWCPWKTHLYELEAAISGNSNAQGLPILFVLYLDTNRMWRVQAVNQPDSFESRLPLPEAWRGLRDEELVQVSGIDGCTFVHASGFTGGNRTYEGVLAMAVAALEMSRAAASASGPSNSQPTAGRL
ncbi:hypothetical protein CDCA_CDCA17G4401 [Cyanidium caldarium]|uniref:Metal-dependent protein hydrolase n=1 Tax=Cyanidium caldarium TaxID=2771 RepID=A0AAV9J263_CYACA|nr:hypothetical protein CDCA_CDCA17G4401 [Cyanidium caldarium]